MNLKIVQPNTIWQNAKANRKAIEKFLKENKQPADIIVLPEMFTTGFCMETEKLAEKPKATTETWMATLAAKHNAAVIGSLIVKVGKKTYNRLIFMPPTGVAKYYDKKHLFTFANEQNHFNAGNKRLIINYNNWKICPLICYDLRFPVWSRNDKNIDLFIYVANWPKARIEAWNSLLTARAIENVAYVCGVNRVGTDGNNIEYNGNSQIVDFKGETLVRSADAEFCYSLKLPKEPMLKFRKKFPVLDDADDFKLTV